MKLLSILILLLGSSISFSCNHDPSLSPQAFNDSITKNTKAIILDVRSPEEFAQGHIRGAINIDVNSNTFKDKTQQLDRQANYYVYCRSGRRSSSACSLMQKQGFAKIIELSGGIIAWESSNYSLVTSP